MTVVIGMEIRPGTVMFVGDEQRTSGHVRTSNITQKLKNYGEHIYGNAGDLTFTNSVYNALCKDTGNKTLEEKAEYISEVVCNLKIGDKKRIFKNKYGVDFDDVINAESLTNPNLDKIKESLNEIERDMRRGSYAEFIIGGDHTDSESPIYIIPANGEVIPFEKYVSMGSGIDRSDIVISDYLQSLTPKERESIKTYEGCRIMMLAARNAWGNVGVGGRTQVKWKESGNSIKDLGVEESELLQNALFAESKKYLSKDFTDGVFKDIIEHGAKAEDMIKRINKKIGKNDLMRLYFVDGHHM